MRLDWLTFFVAALATYRLTVLISRDRGPFDLFLKLRGVERFSKLLKCPFCVSVYTGALVTIILWLCGIVTVLALGVLVALALSAISIILDRCFTSDYTN